MDYFDTDISSYDSHTWPLVMLDTFHELVYKVRCVYGNVVEDAKRQKFDETNMEIRGSIGNFHDAVSAVAKHFQCGASFCVRHISFKVCIKEDEMLPFIS